MSCGAIWGKIPSNVPQLANPTVKDPDGKALQTSAFVSKWGIAMAYEKELIEHLSKEITASIQKMSELRSKTNLVIFLGPYALIGAAFFRQGAKANIGNISTVDWFASGILFFCFVSMGLLMAMVEKHNWRQCNEYRRIIFALHASNGSNSYQMNDILFKERLLSVYFLAYFLLGVSCVATIFLIFRILV